MYTFEEKLTEQLREIELAGITKRERAILSPQGALVQTQIGECINFCANNYLGIANDPSIVTAAKAGLDKYGFGLSSVRFICGTQDQHRLLEQNLAQYLQVDDAILFSSCFDANGGVFEALLSPNDAIISDELNHASLIDGIRLCKASRYRYKNADLQDLERCLYEAREKGAEHIMIVTDGVFSMDGSFAPLPEICQIAEQYHAIVLVDDSHAVGFIGEHGRGTPEYFGVQDKVDILTGTLGKAIGGASGGYVAGPQAVIDILRQKARPYLFSNTLAPAVVAGSLQALEIAKQADQKRKDLQTNATLFRTIMQAEGFDLLPGNHPIIAVMFPGEQGARLAGKIANRMLEIGVYVTAFSFPVVPRGKARIRVQLSAGHTQADIQQCVQAFVKARNEL